MESLQQPRTQHEGLNQIKYVHHIFQKYFCLLFKQYGGNFLNIFFFRFCKNLFSIEGELLDDISLTSAVHQHELAIGVHMSPRS